MTQPQGTAELGRTADPGPMIDIRNLSLVGTGGVRILDDVSLSLRTGETLGLLGESGSGKSMTALAILGLLPRGVHVESGSITVAGTDVVGAREATLRRLRASTLGMVFQDPTSALDPTMKVGIQITEAGRRNGSLSRSEANAQAVDLLSRVEISDPHERADLYPHQMSGGMRQRAVIAMALAGNPTVILADEPTTALDATVQGKILDLLTTLKDEQGLGLLMISHDLRVLSHVADRVVVMYAGRIVETGPTDQVLSQPQHWYTSALIDSIPSVRSTRRVRPIGGTPASPATRPSGCPFHPRCAAATAICSEKMPDTTVSETPSGPRTLACHHPKGLTDDAHSH